MDSNLGPTEGNRGPTEGSQRPAEIVGASSLPEMDIEPPVTIGPKLEIWGTTSRTAAKSQTTGCTTPRRRKSITRELIMEDQKELEEDAARRWLTTQKSSPMKTPS